MTIFTPNRRDTEKEWSTKFLNWSRLVVLQQYSFMAENKYKNEKG